MVDCGGPETAASTAQLSSLWFPASGPVKRLDIALGRSVVYRVLSSDEGKDGLRCGIGLREGGRPGLLQDLQLDKLHLLLGEVGVVDTAARGFIVVHGRLQVILLESEAFLAVADVSH